MKKLHPLLALLLCCAALTHAESLRVPGFTAYLTPYTNGARVSAPGGVSRWTDPKLKVLWFGQFKQSGELKASVALRLPQGAESRLRLTMNGQSREAQVVGAGESTTVTANFGSFSINPAGYKRFALESLNPAGGTFGDVDALLLEGPALAGAHFNLKERRNAASVHLMYPTPPDARIDWFYNEVSAAADPVHTFYMACGFHRGYFGMQVNSPTERRIIFSVWDSGNEAVDRNKVAAPDRVQLIAKGEGVVANDFGNEGTGGHSHLVYSWKTGQPQRFLLGAKPAGATHTIYAGYWFHPEKKQWMLIAAMKAPKDGGYLKRLHSFSENFVGGNGHLQRKAFFGNQWIHLAGGGWQELVTASFSHDATGRADRLDRFMGVESGRFFLAHGGYTDGFTPYGEKFTRPAAGQLPSAITLPVIPDK